MSETEGLRLFREVGEDGVPVLGLEILGRFSITLNLDSACDLCEAIDGFLQSEGYFDEAEEECDNNKRSMH